MLVYGFPHTTPQALASSTPTPTPTPYPDPTPQVTYPMIFSRLSTPTYNIFTKGFTQEQPTSIGTPTPTPYTDSAPRAK